MFASDVSFTANLRTFTSSVAGPTTTYLRLSLQNCGANIPRTAAGTKAVQFQSLYPDTTGLVSATVTPNSDIFCGVVQGSTQYLIEVRQRSAPPGMPDTTIASGTYYISGAFVLDTATPYNPQTPPGVTFAGNVTQTIANGTVTLGTSPISAGTCAGAVIVTSASVQSSDSVAWAYVTIPGVVPQYRVFVKASAGSLSFFACNDNAGSITPAGDTLNWRVTR